MEYVVGQDLTSLHTMGCRSQAEKFVSIKDVHQLQEVLQDARQNGLPLTVLGGGSNVLFKEVVHGIVIRMANQGIEMLEDGCYSGECAAGCSFVRVQAGENWHRFVEWTLEKRLGGLENLSLIPGTVGAAPIQNIGAYGVEVKDSIAEVVALEVSTGETLKFSADDCEFSYRDSVFKRHPGNWIITEVVFRLSSKAPLRLEYAELNRVWMEAGEPSSYQAVGKLVESIRRNKLPDPDHIPNSGSFFKNPTVDEALYQKILSRYPDLVAFPNGVNHWKLAAGWLIQQCGWKGFLKNGVGVYEKQALVIVNPGQRTAEEVKALASRIQQSVLDKFDVCLEIEPIIL
ncbi:UDP-N-acetylmuramate dehydrogenase [Hahella ganghwensis]|uniref:UDP-N-acetylmuramate dehydrogenase n=1 Tax=Hahella ganghwensis TaxID=286420 RepID=UPI00039E27E6|nr:UDP-N-acetylmuramate dehydrogenase [Hahella ganghwensis]